MVFVKCIKYDAGCPLFRQILCVLQTLIYEFAKFLVLI